MKESGLDLFDDLFFVGLHHLGHDAQDMREASAQHEEEEEQQRRKPKLRRGRSGTLKMDDKDAQEMRDASAQHQRANL